MLKGFAVFVSVADNLWSDGRLMGSCEKSCNESDVSPVEEDPLVDLGPFSVDGSSDGVDHRSRSSGLMVNGIGGNNLSGC